MLFAQAYFGTVSGVLSDPSGAVIPNAKVILIDEQKGFVFTAKSNDEGRYLFASIPPGVYTVRWRVVSVDTHATQGDFSFRVGP